MKKVLEPPGLNLSIGQAQRHLFAWRGPTGDLKSRLSLSSQTPTGDGFSDLYK